MTAIDPITALLRAAQKPLDRYLWTPADMITFTPAVVERTFGDGRCLYGLSTINNRPAYWIIRGCSTWDVAEYAAPDGAPEFIDFVDDIVFAIEDEFRGCASYERNRRGDWIDQETKRFVPRAWTEYPTIDDENGCHWFRLKWPELEGVEIEPHPWARTNMLRLPAPPYTGGR